MGSRPYRVVGHALTAHQPVCASQGLMGQTPMAAQIDRKLLALVHSALQPATRGQRGDTSSPAEAGDLAGGSHCGSQYLLVNP